MTTRERAYQLWNKAGRPQGRDLDFWLRAELEIAVRHICTISPGNAPCPYQKVQPTYGGRCQAICVADWVECGNRASDKL